jgi:predicted MFS family arabinose efflux permease
MLAALGLFVVSNLITAVAPTFGIALLSRMLAGLGAAMFSPTATGGGSMLVPPERRGYALSVIVAGLTGATALGSPIGAVIGGLGDWRWTMVFVSTLGMASLLGVWTLLPEMPLPPAVNLRARLAPLADRRIMLTLATTLLAMSGAFTIYTYFSVVFDRAIGGSAAVLGALLVAWGASGTISNLINGRLIDKIGSRKVLMILLTALVVDVALMPWTGASLWTAAIAIALWGGLAWGTLVPQQFRLVTLAPSIAPVVIGLNTSAVYLGASLAGVIGATGLRVVGAHELPVISALLFTAALIATELASREIARQAAPAKTAPREFFVPVLD